MLDSCGHKFTGLSGILKVSKGALVVMKEHKTVSEELLGSTQLWHQRICHMSERGL